MKALKDYIKESRSVLADIDDQLESGDEALKFVVKNSLKKTITSQKAKSLYLIL